MRSQTRVRPPQKGFSLIEIIWATSILAVALTGVLAFALHTMRVSEYNSNLNKAKEAAQKWMNRIEAQDPEDRRSFLQNNPGFDVDGLSHWNTGQNPGSINFVVDPNIQPQSRYNQTIQVEIIVEWDGLEGRSKYRTMRLFYYRVP